MKYAIIDVGSNSVRLMLWDKKTLSKKVNCTRLAENLQNGFLDIRSVNRTVNAVLEFVDNAESEGADKIYIFGTAALRKAKNPEMFTEKVFSKTGIDVDIISGEKEAEIGALGALNGADGGVIDVGGASSEIVVVKGGKVVYEMSADIGAVTLTDACGSDLTLANKYIEEKNAVYGEIPKTNFFSVGGTATSLASVLQKLEPYNPEKVQGFVLKIDEVKRLTDEFYSMSEEKRKDLVGLQKERAKIIHSGTHILLKIMQKSGIDFLTVSESDNLEGYILDRLKK